MNLKQIQLVITLVIIIAAFLVMKKFGLFRVKSKEEKQEKTEKKIADYKITREEALSPKFWSSQPKSKLLPQDDAEDLAKDIRRRLNAFIHGYSYVSGLISGLDNKAQLSQISFYFLDKYGKNLATYLTTHLWRGETANINALIENLPD